MFKGPFEHSIIKRAQNKQLVEIQLVNIRQFAIDRYGTVDDQPYGGGQGMILRVDVLDKALNTTKATGSQTEKTRIILLDPKGTRYTQKKAQFLSKFDHLILVCGHYEGVDERVSSLVDESISIGEYILTGGEIPAMVIADSVIRLLPGVLRNSESSTDESFTDNLLEYPQYTRPPEYQDMTVPEVLLSGNHQQIDAWRTTHKTRTHEKKNSQTK